MKLHSFALPVMSLFQERLIFKPRLKGVLPLQLPTQHGLEGFETFELVTEDGIMLEAWHLPAAKADAPTTVFFHGNTGNLCDVGRPLPGDTGDFRAYRVGQLQALQEAGVGIVALSLRGYGRSGGRPGEAGFLRDFRALNRWLLQQDWGRPDKLIYFGESLGAANALLAAESLYRIEHTAPALVVTLAAFFSIPAKTAELYAFLPVEAARRAMRHRFECARAVASLPRQSFLLLLVPELDKTTPKAHTYQLAAIADHAGLPHEVVELKGAGHISWNPREVTSLILAFYHAHQPT